jgi:HEAT repeat protein
VIDPTILHCLETLRDSHDPEARHAAIRTLANCDWHEHREALSGLIYAARYDEHPGMRVAAIRLLVSVKAGTPEVITGLKPLLNDKDEWIRHETSQALAVLQTSLTSHTVEASH